MDEGLKVIYLVVYTLSGHHLSVTPQQRLTLSLVSALFFVPRCPSVAACWTSMGVNKV